MIRRNRALNIANQFVNSYIGFKIARNFRALGLQLFKKQTLPQVFSLKFFEIFKAVF